GVMDRLGVQEGEVITHRLVTRAIEKAQQRVENYNFDIRKRLIDYDDVMNKQREVIYGRRDEIMEAGELKEILEAMIDGVLESKVAEYIDPKELPESWRIPDLLADLETTFLFSFPAPDTDGRRQTVETLVEHLRERSREALETRERFLADELGNVDVVKEFEKYVLLQTIDEKWMDHLHELDYLKEGIHFRAYAQKDPLVEYKKEAYGLFAELNETIDKDALYAFFHARIALRPRARRDLSAAQAVHRETGVYGMEHGGMGASPATDAALSQPSPDAVAKPKVRTADKVGRNDPCPCGSGKKYKRCCGS
ncbi:MAG: preprotein translocase subunit SecA, partial [Candidatus Krumholzibacteriota bacterium]|nr:preprotein translocase subunit SecA [Candidatus Krumholzibacteriota bacterium]